MPKNSIFEQDINQQLRLPWSTICKLAVKARCAGLSLNDVMERAVAEYVATPNRPNRK